MALTIQYIIVAVVVSLALAFVIQQGIGFVSGKKSKVGSCSNCAGCGCGSKKQA
jgi:hypothetical protein